MRILMAARTADPASSGSALFGFRLAAGLAAAGHEVVVLTARAPRERARPPMRIELVPGVPFWPIASQERIPFPPRRHVESFIEGLQPDVVHVQDHFLVARTALDAARRRRIPVLATNHFLPANLLPFFPVPAAARPRLERLLWRDVAHTFGRADLVTTPSETGVSWLRAAGLRTEALAVSCGVDLDVFRPDPQVDGAELRRRLGLQPGRVTLAYVGRLERDKHLDDLLRALAHPSFRATDGRDQGPQLVVVGGGWDARRYRQLAAKLGLSDRVHFTGRIPRRDLVAILNAVDLFAMPSPAELQSIATLEAMAVGRPILAAAAGALPELVQPEVNGRLFRAGDPDDAARQLWALAEERALWPRMAEASREIAGRHGLPATVARYESLYQGLIARRH